MSSELERRLEAMLADAPEPDPGAGEEALHRAVRALRPVATPRRGLRTAALVFAAMYRLLALSFCRTRERGRRRCTGRCGCSGLSPPLGAACALPSSSSRGPWSCS